jgi:hypothetical protein
VPSLERPPGAAFSFGGRCGLALGYTPSLAEGDPTRPTFAAGLRSFTSGAKHRAFLEGAVSQLLVETGAPDGGSRLLGSCYRGATARYS